MSKYNGWANYATWKVMVEFFDGFDIVDHGGYIDGNECKDMVLDYIGSESGGNLVADWARCFLDDVDWEEIAQSMSEDADLEEEIA